MGNFTTCTQSFPVTEVCHTYNYGYQF
nr:unnamed protein product [Callosobruchus analis]